MKKKLFFVLLSALLLASCGDGDVLGVKETSIYSTGKVLDVLVVANHDAFSKPTTELIDSIFTQPPRFFVNSEQRFNLLRLPLDKLQGNRVFQSYRSIVVCNVAKGNSNNVSLERNKWVRPQVCVMVSASCEDSLRALLRRYEPQIVNAFYDVEHQRFIELYSGSARNSTIIGNVKKKYGFSIAVANTFRWLKEQDDFVWIQEKLVEPNDKIVLSNLLIHTVSYEGQSQFQREQLLDRLDNILRRYVPDATGGYPGIERDSTLCELLTTQVDYPGAKYCIHTQGWWGLRGTDNRMGGPVVAYSILSPDEKTIVDVIGFVYAPKHNKRDFLLKLESMCYSIRW